MLTTSHIKIENLSGTNRHLFVPCYQGLIQD